MTDFIQSSVIHGLKFDEFDHLSKSDRKKLVKLMARISEKSFRRGFQHGVEIPRDEVLIEPCKLRFQTSLNISPAPHYPMKWSAIGRLFMEYPLEQVGFSDPDENSCYPTRYGRRKEHHK